MGFRLEWPRKSLITFLVGVFVMIGHVCLAIYIFAGVSRISMNDRIDLLLLIGPLTAAYFLSVIRYSIENPGPSTDQSKVGALYIVVSVFATVPFVVGLFLAVNAYDSESLNDLDMVKRLVGGIEIWFGAAFGLFVNSLFPGK